MMCRAFIALCLLALSACSDGRAAGPPAFDPAQVRITSAGDFVAITQDITSAGAAAAAIAAGCADHVIDRAGWRTYEAFWTGEAARLSVEDPDLLYTALRRMGYRDRSAGYRRLTNEGLGVPRLAEIGTPAVLLPPHAPLTEGLAPRGADNLSCRDGVLAEADRTLIGAFLRPPYPGE